jgi:signal transduction histidine kinase
VLEIATRERNRLGSDLHDGLGQELTGIALMLRSLATRVNRGEGPRPGEVEDLLAMVNATIESARALAHGLAPVALTHDGLVSALVTMIERLRKSSGIDIRFESNCRGPLTLTDPVAQHLYRIAQEALTNALRHASPTRVIVRIKSDGRVVELSVRDDGTGLPEHAHPFSGMGLKIMRYRARLIGGEIALRRRASGGTRVSCTVRLSSPAEPVPASLSAAPTHPG